MLVCRRAQRGMTLIELVIGIAIVAMLLAMALPSLGAWIQNTRIRNTAEAFQNGLQLARATAVQRNTWVRFQITDTVTASCALLTTGTNWVISQDLAAGACATAPSDTTAPRIIQVRAATEGSINAVVAADLSLIVFDGRGRVTPPPAADIAINISNPTGGACAMAGPMRCLRVVVSTGGQVRMCDPARASTDPRGC